MQVLFNSFYFKVYQKGNQIYFKETVRMTLYMGIIGMVLGLIFYVLEFLFPTTSASFLFTKWSSLLIIGASTLLVLVSIIRTLKKPFRIDTDKKILVWKNKTIALSGNERLTVKRHTFANTPYLRIELDAAQRSYYLSPLVQEKHEEELIAVINPINEKLFTATSDLHFDPSPSPVAKSFIVWLLCLIGAVWTVSAWYFIPHIATASIGSDRGLLVWPFGIWIMALGLFHTLGFKVLQKRLAALTLTEKLLMIGWGMSYCIICSVAV